MNNLGARVREIRKSQGRSAAYVLSKLQKKGGWLSRREHGHTEITVSDLVEISNVLEVSMDSFFCPETTEIMSNSLYYVRKEATHNGKQKNRPSNSQCAD